MRVCVCQCIERNIYKINLANIYTTNMRNIKKFREISLNIKGFASKNGPRVKIVSKNLFVNYSQRYVCILLDYF